MRHQVAGANVVRLKVGNVGLGIFDAKEGPRPGVLHHTFDFDGPKEPVTAALRQGACVSLLNFVPPLQVGMSKHAIQPKQLSARKLKHLLSRSRHGA